MTKRTTDIIKNNSDLKSVSSSFSCSSITSLKNKEYNFDDYDVIACLAYSQLNASNSNCCNFVKMIYSKVGKTISSCYGNDSTKVQKESGAVVQWATDVHVAIYIDDNHIINGNWVGKVQMTTLQEAINTKGKIVNITRR